MFEIFDHTADVGIRVVAQDLPGLFCDAARGLFWLITGNLAEVSPRETVEFRIHGADLDLLLFDWLHELLYCFDSRRMLLCEFSVVVQADGLQATARGEPFEPHRHRLEHELKAITYHGLRVEREGPLWKAEVIIDI